MRLFIVIIPLLFLSCGTYQHASYDIKSVLAITEAGDTIAVPIKEFERNKYDNYTRFRYNDNWYYNQWRYDFNWQWNPPFFSYPNIFWWNNNLRSTNPSRGYRQNNRNPKLPNERLVPRQRPKPKPKSYIRTPRGSSYNNRNSNTNNPRTYVRPNPPRQTKSNYNIGRKNRG